MRTDLLAPAEEPGLWTPPAPGTRLVRGRGFTLVVRHESGTAERVRVTPGAVPAALEEARRLARAAGVTEVVWWVGELTPPGTADALLRCGLIPYVEEPVLISLTIDRPPPAVPEVDVRRVADLETYREALEVNWDAWGMPREARERRRASAPEAWESQEASGVIEHHLARLAGRPAGFGRLVATGAAGVLMGGSVAPWARGRGVYRALVRARWEATVARGTPCLVTSAGAMSAPVLARLGFARIGEVRLLRDPVV